MKKLIFCGLFAGVIIAIPYCIFNVLDVFEFLPRGLSWLLSLLNGMARINYYFIVTVVLWATATMDLESEYSGILQAIKQDLIGICNHNKRQVNLYHLTVGMLFGGAVLMLLPRLAIWFKMARVLPIAVWSGIFITGPAITIIASNLVACLCLMKFEGFLPNWILRGIDTTENTQITFLPK